MDRSAYHGVDSDLRGDIDGLLIMPALRQGLHKSQPGDRLCLPDEFADFSDTIIRVVKHYGKPQPPAIGKLELVALLQTHGLHGMASDLRRQGRGMRSPRLRDTRSRPCSMQP